MPADIFSRGGNDFGGSIAADSARLVFSASGLADGGVGLLTQNVSINYSQQINRIYELGTQKTYFVVGRAQGQVSLGRVLGPRAVQLGFYQKFGDACNAAENNIDFLADTGCTQTGGQVVNFTNGVYSFGVRNAVIMSIAISVATQDMVINEQLQMMFVSLVTTAGR